MLSHKDKEYVIGRYNMFIKKHGYSPKSIGDPKRYQGLRFQI